MYILNEKMKNARKGRKFKCKYCDERLEIADLIIHIDEEHNELIPQGQTAAQVVYNIVNKREYGSCMMCKQKTKWDEEKWRYNAFCGETCHNNYVKRFNTNMKNSGKEDQMKNPEHQKKMLEGRKISGHYKFEDGGDKTYCGSYEKQLLEFEDTICHIKSEDLDTPGPVIEYTYKGEKKFWITDQFYKPFNLVFDVKPGGNNKNTNPEMEDNRQKQKAKQDQIIKDGVYNYIELTDNNFAELFTILKEIKLNMIDDKNEKVIMIYEDNQINKLKYLIPYSENGYMITGYAGSNNILLEDIFIEEDGKLVRQSKSFLNNKSFSIYKGDMFDGKAKSLLESFGIEVPKDINYLDKIYDSNGVYDLSNILKQEEFKNIKGTEKIESLIESALLNESKSLTEAILGNEDDLILNFDEWTPESNNILFITGLSGSGKTTLGKEYAKKYNAELLELDNLYDEYDFSLIDRARKNFPEYDKLIKEGKKSTPKNDFRDEFTLRRELILDVTEFLLTEMSKEKRLFIVEGTQVFSTINTNFLQGKPLIVKGTSLTTSAIRRIKRTYEKGDSIADIAKDLLGIMFRGNVGLEKRLTKFKSSLTESIDDKYNKYRNPLYPDLDIEKAIRDGGFYGYHDIWNSLIVINDKLVRVRVENLVLSQDKSEVFLNIINSNKYKLPGGSTEEGISYIQQAINETKEEARILVKDIKNSGINYIEFYSEEDKNERRKSEWSPLIYDGCVSYVFVSTYDKPFKGYIHKDDTDAKMVKYGKFHKINEIKKTLKKEHKEAINLYINKYETLSEGSSHDNYSSLYYILDYKLSDNETTVIPGEQDTKYENEIEINTTDKISVSTSIDKFLRRLPEQNRNIYLYVYEPYDYTKLITKIPTYTECPEVEITDTVWILNKCRMRYVGCIFVDAPIDDEVPLVYGDKQKTELYDWDWRWDSKATTTKDISNLIDENVLILKSIKNKQCMITESKSQEEWNEDYNIYEELLEDFSQYSGMILTESLVSTISSLFKKIYLSIKSKNHNTSYGDKPPAAKKYTSKNTKELYLTMFDEGDLEYSFDAMHIEPVTDDDKDYIAAGKLVIERLAKVKPNANIRGGINHLKDGKESFLILWIDDDHSTAALYVLGKKKNETIAIPIWIRNISKKELNTYGATVISLDELNKNTK